MTTTGGVTKGILIFSCAYFLFVLFVQAATGQTAMAVFMLVGFLVPLSFVICGYMQDKKDRKQSQGTSIPETGSDPE
jgi:hypothetical protein